MSRDTRLDRLLVDFAEKAQRLDKCSDGELFIAGKAYDAARRAIEELHAEVIEERETYRRAWNRADEELVNLRAASLSVSPVPPQRSRENFRELLDEFQGFCEEACRVIWQVPTSEYPRLDTRQEVRELRNRNAARDRLISKFDETLAAVSAVPEPSESPEERTFVCRGCGCICVPEHRDEYGLWRDGSGDWYAIHKWCHAGADARSISGDTPK